MLTPDDVFLCRFGAPGPSDCPKRVQRPEIHSIVRTLNSILCPKALAEHLKRLLENRIEARVTIQEKGDIRSAEYQIRSAGEISAKPT